LLAAAVGTIKGLLLLIVAAGNDGAGTESELDVLTAG
jgi:hypothetical protein